MTTTKQGTKSTKKGKEATKHQKNMQLYVGNHIGKIFTEHEQRSSRLKHLWILVDVCGLEGRAKLIIFEKILTQAETADETSLVMSRAPGGTNVSTEATEKWLKLTGGEGSIRQGVSLMKKNGERYDQLLLERLENVKTWRAAYAVLELATSLPAVQEKALQKTQALFKADLNKKRVPSARTTFIENTISTIGESSPILTEWLKLCMQDELVGQWKAKGSFVHRVNVAHSARTFPHLWSEYSIRIESEARMRLRNARRQRVRWALYKNLRYKHPFAHEVLAQIIAHTRKLEDIIDIIQTSDHNLNVDHYLNDANVKAMYAKYAQLQKLAQEKAKK